MLSSWSIRNFLIRQPTAHEVRVTREGDVGIVAKGGSWAKCADTLRALQPDLVELLDKDGKVIRAMRPAEEHDAEASSPEPPAALAGNAEAAMLTHFANLIHRAYEHSTTVAFSKMVELVERIDGRADTIEARLERTEAAYRRAMQQRIDDALDQAEELQEQSGSGDLLTTMANTFAQGASQSRANESAPSNGKGRAS